jgi:hypothetical protein
VFGVSTKMATRPSGRPSPQKTKLKKQAK